MSKVERHFGICQACIGEFHVHGGKMVLHGYKRPGIGYIVGDCTGVGAPPYELSCELQKKLAHAYRSRIADLQKSIDRFSSPSFSQPLEVEDYSSPIIHNPITRRSEHAMMKVSPPHYRWEEKRRSLIANWQSDQRYLQHSVDRWEAMIKDWHPRPARSFMEIQEQVKAQKEAAAGARQRAFEAKMEKLVEGSQKRIDTTLKGMAAEYEKAKKKGTLDTLWLSADRYVEKNRLESLFEMVTSIIKKIKEEGKLANYAVAAERVGRPDLIRALGIVDENDVVRLVTVMGSRGKTYQKLPEFDDDSTWTTVQETRMIGGLDPAMQRAPGPGDMRRIKVAGPTQLRAREGMIAYFQRGKASGRVRRR